ncbi:hypothetical protein ACFY9X_11785 [Streptomyces nigra]|uniref:hypothetical protein n=1 Tax=Streptomyces nigra TaxID=1827580 RepID=UPI0036E7387F
MTGQERVGADAQVLPNPLVVGVQVPGEAVALARRLVPAHLFQHLPDGEVDLVRRLDHRWSRQEHQPLEQR